MCDFISKCNFLEETCEIGYAEWNIYTESLCSSIGHVSSEKKRARRGRSSRAIQEEQEEAIAVDDQENAEPAPEAAQAGKKGKQKRRRLTKAQQC